MCPIAALFQEELAAASNDHFAVVDKRMEHLLDIERFRPVIHQCDIDNAVGCLKRCKLDRVYLRPPAHRRLF